jgi:hypothetical protein
MRMIGRWHRQLWGLAALGMLAMAAPASAQSVPEIRAVQQRLAELGYDPGEVDGMMGSRTREAVAAFQSDMGLERTGEITVSLLNVLGANPNAPRPLEEIQGRLVDIIGARWEEQAGPGGSEFWTPPPAETWPAFADYPADGEPDPLVEHVDFASHPDAELFGDALRAAVGEPADFAGRFRVVLVGCGTTCEAALVLDAASGRVLAGPTAEFGVAYRLDSRLLVVNPAERVTAAFAAGAIPSWAATRWFVFDGSEFLTLTPVEPEPDAGQEAAEANEAADAVPADE